LVERIASPAPLADRGRWLSVGTVALVVALAVAAALVGWLAPRSLAGRDASTLAAGVIFAASYLALAVGKIPFLAIDRAGVALVGACLMVMSDALSPQDAYTFDRPRPVPAVFAAGRRVRCWSRSRKQSAGRFRFSSEEAECLMPLAEIPYFALQMAPYL
jgi:hypothetical protein